MSSLIESYALSCGVSIGEPTAIEAFFPFDHSLDKTILLHAFSGGVNNNNATFPAKIYSHFSEVVNLLKPLLEPLGYKIFQIGGAGEPAIPGIESLCGQTTYNQCVYLVKRCALLIGNDSTWIHHRGAFRGAMVGVYGPTDVKNHGPYWKDPEKTILLESHRLGKKPSYASGENVKTVDMILPESVANAALKLLGQAPCAHRSFWFGAAYYASIVELVPNVVVGPHVQTGGPLVIRMDYHFDEKILAQNLSLRQCAIITNREIDVNLLMQFKPNIASIRIEIDGVSPDWIKKVKRTGIPMGVFALETDPKKIVEMRLRFADACLFDLFVPPTKQEFEKSVLEYQNKSLDIPINFNTLQFKTNKFLLSDGKVYLSKAHWKAGKFFVEGTQKNYDAIIDHGDFWQDLQHFYFYQ
jgi:hypothetical protein